MAEIGTLGAGIGAVTVIAGQSQCDQYIVIGTVEPDIQLSALSVEIDGTPFIQIVGANLVKAFTKYKMEMGGLDAGGDYCPANMIKIATGSIRRNTTFRFTNDAAGAATIYAFSEAGKGVPFIATTKQINATSYEVFDKFSALIMDSVANISNLEISFRDGSKSTLTIPEVNGLFALKNNSNPGGLLGACACLDNSDQSIESVRISTGAGGPASVLTVKLPDEAFKLLNR